MDVLDATSSSSGNSDQVLAGSPLWEGESGSSNWEGHWSALNGCGRWAPAILPSEVPIGV